MTILDIQRWIGKLDRFGKWTVTQFWLVRKSIKLPAKLLGDCPFTEPVQFPYPTLYLISELLVLSRYELYLGYLMTTPSEFSVVLYDHPLGGNPARSQSCFPRASLYSEVAKQYIMLNKPAKTEN
jgi:hypothetical protein